MADCSPKIEDELGTFCSVFMVLKGTIEAIVK